MQVILTHEHTDFDALGSLLGAHKLFPEAVPVLPRALNRNLRRFLVLYRGQLPFRDADALPRARIERAIFVDSQTAQFVRGMTPQTPVLIIDHHAREPDLPEHYVFEGERLGATVSLLVERMQPAGIELEPVEATLMLLGIYEDTGRLSYTGTRPRDLRAAAWLLEQGARLEVVDEFLDPELSEAQLALYDQLRATAETHQVHGQPIVIASAESPEPVEEISALAPRLLGLLDPAGLFLLVRLRGHVQLVARSTTDRVDVGAVAEALGGGGHRRAAAAVYRGEDLDLLRRRLLTALENSVRPPTRVAQLMSRGLRTLPPSASIAEAEAAMRQHGHEGFPVVEEGRLLGLITRREVDRAIFHDQHKRPVAEHMRSGRVTVQPEDSLRQLRQRMVEEGWGQVPVVDDEDRLIGIVTRSDLLALWDREERLS